MRNLIPCFVLLTTTSAWAQPKVALEPKKPTSVSYQAIVKCEPKLEDHRLTTRVDLAILKSRMDDVYVTQRSLLMQRVVDFRERSGELRRLRLENRPEKGVSKYTAQWRTVLPDGDTVAWEDATLKEQPTLKEVYLVIAKGVIERDESLTEEFKLKGVKLRVKKDLQRPLELRLEHEDGSRSLLCEEKKDLGTICTCTKK
ncbi:MAG TPA: hypothetical protein PL182_09775 [Pseudobdellovibrionaceae bacterium]|nr:hypothetical protein [Pseudobdellovibrionaceae bacterium]